jgi:RimJ/RimL family protein N-acetyltransferase
VPELLTPRLRLREWREQDLGPFAEMNADQRVMRLLQGPMTVEESAASLTRLQDAWRTQGWGLFAVERRQDATFVGFCGLAYVTFPAVFEPKVEIGWRLAHPYWNNGYATEAARRVLDWLFDDLAWPEIVTFTRQENHRSQAVIERLGMRREPEFDFDLPSPPNGEGGSRHVFYRLRAAQRRRPSGRR